MRGQILGLRTASVVFGLISVLQLARLIVRLEVLAAGRRVPLWMSAIAFIVMGSMSLWLWGLSRAGGR